MCVLIVSDINVLLLFGPYMLVINHSDSESEHSDTSMYIDQDSLIEKPRIDIY